MLSRLCLGGTPSVSGMPAGHYSVGLDVCTGTWGWSFAKGAGFAKTLMVLVGCHLPCKHVNIKYCCNLLTL